MSCGSHVSVLTILLLMQGPYVLVMVATGRHQNSNKLPAMWLISAYRSLSKPFRKNVRYIVLVRPTSGLKTLVAVIRPFVSSKAAKKVKKVQIALCPLLCDIQNLELPLRFLC